MQWSPKICQCKGGAGEAHDGTAQGRNQKAGMLAAWLSGTSTGRVQPEETKQEQEQKQNRTVSAGSYYDGLRFMWTGVPDVCVCVWM